MYRVKINSNHTWYDGGDMTSEIYPTLCTDCLVKMKCLKWGHFKYNRESDKPSFEYIEKRGSIWTNRGCDKLVLQLKELPDRIRRKVYIEIVKKDHI